MTTPITGPTGPVGATGPVTPVTKPVATLSSSGRLTIDRLSTDQLVTVDGRLGVFTAITTGTGTDQTSTDNLQAVVDVLRKQVAELQSNNANLTAQLSAVQQASTSSDEFAAGVQHTLDVLQDKLGTMDNQTSTFAVREFSMQSKVLVDVSDLGTIGLRFVKPGEDVESTALSTVSLTVVPLPKDSSAPVAATPLSADPAIDEIDGLSADQIATLRRAHVSSAATFTKVATRATTSARLAGMLAVDRESLGRLTLLAGLLAVPGLDRIKAAVLFDAGVTDVPTLATASAKDLVRRYAAAAKKRKDDDGFRPTVQAAQAWIDAARAVTGSGSGV
jgi:hypothetical protein